MVDTLPTTGRYLFLRTLRYSSTILFAGYGDDETGFYTVYNEVFNTLAKEDMDHMDEQESDFEVMLLLETETVFQIQNVLVRICGSVGQFVGQLQIRFCVIKEGSGSIPLTNGSGSGRLKNLRARRTVFLKPLIFWLCFWEIQACLRFLRKLNLIRFHFFVMKMISPEPWKIVWIRIRRI